MGNVRKNSKRKRLITDYLSIIFGTGIMCVAIQCVFDPSGMVTGGFAGISIIVKEVTGVVIKGGIPLWLTNLALNVPVFIFGYFMKGKQFVGRTAVATLAVSVWLYIIPHVDFVNGDYFLAAIFGGIFAGAGIGLVLRTNATTGGTDMVAVLLQMKFFRHVPVVQVMQFLDGAIVLTGIAIFGLKRGLYAIVTIYIITKVSDALTEGMRFARTAFIVTNHSEEVSKEIMKNVNRGVTGIKAVGMYSGEDKTMLYCVVNKKQVVILKDVVKEVDPEAFVIVSDAREVLGEGFIEE